MTVSFEIDGAEGIAFWIIDDATEEGIKITFDVFKDRFLPFLKENFEFSLVKPTVEAVACAIYEAIKDMPWLRTVDGTPNSSSYEAARHVLTLFPGRTEGEVKAEALRLAAHDISLWNSIYREFTLQNVVDWLRDRAEHTER